MLRAQRPKATTIAMTLATPCWEVPAAVLVHSTINLLKEIYQMTSRYGLILYYHDLRLILS